MTLDTVKSRGSILPSVGRLGLRNTALEQGLLMHLDFWDYPKQFWVSRGETSEGKTQGEIEAGLYITLHSATQRQPVESVNCFHWKKKGRLLPCDFDV